MAGVLFGVHLKTITTLLMGSTPATKEKAQKRKLKINNAFYFIIIYYFKICIIGYYLNMYHYFKNYFYF